MSLTSFAQNFEDILLWRALGSIPRGRYVDVGAGHPSYHSVTKLFYDAGWSGLNVEPLPARFEALVESRTRDVNVQAAITSRPLKTVELAVVDLWDELSTISGTRQEELRASGRGLSTVEVPVFRLDDLLSANGLVDIHFLKIDVEGVELEVLETIDLSVTRPWIILVEVIAGGTENTERTQIRDRLEGADYAHAYFDGLNDFFVAAEHTDELLPAFSVPVNVTDDFVVAGGGVEGGALMELLAEHLGMSVPAQEAEVLERVGAVVQDRIDFERRWIEESARLEESAKEIDSLHEELAAAAQQERSLRLGLAAFEQTAFERERMVAWYAAELATERARSARTLEAYTKDSERRLIAEQIAHQDSARRLADVLSSTSWRLSLPVRVVRRPGLYLRKLLGR
ncbi:hypothetical protein AGMMS50218_17540 [Actinomycetota bacterium]|nr:hypothetical protein AGMMS50218_17540 [Actinomycetota bacterium]